MLIDTIDDCFGKGGARGCVLGGVTRSGNFQKRKRSIYDIIVDKSSSTLLIVLTAFSILLTRTTLPRILPLGHIIQIPPWTRHQVLCARRIIQGILCQRVPLLGTDK